VTSRTRRRRSEHRLVLQIKTGVDPTSGPSPAAGGSRFPPPIWLPELVTQSVCYDKFSVRIRSLDHLTRTRTRKGIKVVSAEWRTLLKDGTFASRSDLAHRMGVSRARVTQVLGPDATGALGALTH